MSQPPGEAPGKMTREEFRRWAEAQPRGRYERVNGVPVAMAPERIAHLRAKAAIWLALRQAIAATSLPCEALPDGATVEIDDETDYEPDATVTCGPRINDGDIAAPNPVIVVEVMSPSTRPIDAGGKLLDYFRVPSIQHYLLVRTDRAVVIHHRRTGAGIETRLIGSGSIELDPPGISIALADVFAWRQPTA
jgi:Uma2 family endonuclease